MTPRRWLIAAGAGLALLVAAFLGGRSSVRSTVTETKQEGSADAHVQANVQTDSAGKMTDKDTRKVTKRTITEREVPAAGPCPPVHEKIITEEEVDETSDEATDLTVHASDMSITDAHTKMSESTRTETHDRPSLAVQATGVIEGIKLPSTWSAEGQLRVLGPAWLGAGVHKDDHGIHPQASVRVEF